MTDPIYRDAAEDDEEFDPSANYAYLDAKVRPKLEVVKADNSVDEMMAEIIENTLASEVDNFPWRELANPFGDNADRYSVSKILDLDFSDGNPSIMARIANEAASVIQFPRNTAYLHGLGLFSSATVINFQVEQNGRYVPTGLYTLCAQPSGSGKSSAHNFFMDPISEALSKRNAFLYVQHKIFDAQLDALNKQLEKVKNEDRNLIKNIATEIKSISAEKARNPLVNDPLKNVTPESAEEQAGKQGGVVNVCSDEEEAITTYLGIAYGDNKASPNNGVFIAAFGGDKLGTTRISREGYRGHVRGAFAVIAQNASVEVMIKAGASGRGVSERVLIIKENNLMGQRVYSRNRKRFDPELIAEYEALCEKVVEGEYPIQLTMSDECLDMIIDLKNAIEPQCLPGNKYGDERIRGFASKIDQHVNKLAANFHVAEQWNPKYFARPSKEIQRHNMHKAMLICMDLLESYKTMIESASTISGSKLVIEVIAVMKRWALKDVKSFAMDKLRSAVKKEAWYAPIEGVKLDFIINLVARAESMNFCHVKENGADKKKWIVLINPALKAFTVSKDE